MHYALRHSYARVKSVVQSCTVRSLAIRLTNVCSTMGGPRPMKLVTQPPYYFQKFNAFSFSGLFEWFGPGPALKQGKLQQKTPETQRPRCLSGVQSVLRRERR